MKCSGYALTYTCFTCTRCTYKKQDGSSLFFIKRHNRNLLDDPFFYLFQTIMVFIQYLFGFCQVYRRHFFFLPGKTGNKIQVIIQKSVFMTIFSFLFHPVQNLFGFLPCLRIHARLLDFLLKSAYIRDILRMHLIQLSLKKFNLFFQGRLTVHLFIRILLGAFCFLADPEDLQKFIYSFFDFMDTFTSGLLFKKTIFFFPGRCKVAGKGTGHLIKALPVIDHTSCPDPPLQILCKAHQFFFHVLELLSLFIWINIFLFRIWNGSGCNPDLCSLDLTQHYPFYGSDLNSVILS